MADAVVGARLTNSGDPISGIAASLGYDSESAFSAAFKRIMSYAPRQYSRRQNHISPLRENPDIVGDNRLGSVAV